MAVMPDPSPTNWKRTGDNMKAEIKEVVDRCMTEPNELQAHRDLQKALQELTASEVKEVVEYLKNGVDR